MMPILSLISIFLLVFRFESGSHGAQGSPDDLELSPFKCWDHKHKPPHPVLWSVGDQTRTYYMLWSHSTNWATSSVRTTTKIFHATIDLFCLSFLFLKDSARLVDLLWMNECDVGTAKRAKDTLRKSTLGPKYNTTPPPHPMVILIIGQDFLFLFSRGRSTTVKRWLKEMN